MRKLLFSLTIIVLLIFTGFAIYRGTSFAKLAVYGVTQIQSKNEDIDEKTNKMNDLVNSTYPLANSTLTASSNELQKNKKDYEDQAVLLSDSKYYKQTEKYKVEFLWTKIGNYAKDNNVELKLEATESTTKGLYDLNFTATGKYADVAQFIYDIENDSRLGFKIEDFSMTSASGATDDGKTVYNRVEGKFTCKEIKIDVKSIDQSEEKTDNANTTTNSNTEANTEANTADNTTNTTAETNTTNTTTTNSTENTTTTNTTDTNNTTSDVNANQTMQDANAVNGNTAQ